MILYMYNSSILKPFKLKRIIFAQQTADADAVNRETQSLYA